MFWWLRKSVDVFLALASRTGGAPAEAPDERGMKWALYVHSSF